ncbi:DNA/RNA non-specific endonuclease [Synechococcus sp. PCC 7336]|uniref:DNA/RNA non-specific endonuclease n=1 Tax=Synechococcus sp. PCC 7336 TaxID=195250 RepID=UPI0008FBE9F5|nr:DNA/RNA non-specific endonuclease [Synechococcus sp. PCC 7336]
MNALIVYNPNAIPIRLPTVTPWGGRYQGGDIADTNGHIIAHILGGSNFNRSNFIAQNSSINSGGYREFERRVREHLEELGKDFNRQDYEDLKEILEEATRACVAIPDNVPAVNVRVKLVRDEEFPLLGSPFRPNIIVATAAFSDGTIFEGIFFNDPNRQSRPGVTWTIRTNRPAP